MADPALAIESVALHEIGHAVSLLDLYDADDKPYVMYHRPGYKHDDLTQDDKNGAIWAYPRDLQDAIDLAYGEEDQDTVMVPKTYSQDVYMKGGLTLRGDVDGELGEGINGIVYVMNISNVTLMDLDISASGYCPGVYISNSSPAIDDNNIEGYAAIYCNNYSFPDILQTKLHSGEYGIYVDIYSLPEVRYNDITNNNKGVYLDDYTDAFLGDEVNGGNNNIINYSYNVYASYDAALEILAQYNWWGTTDRDAILSKLHHENPNGQIVFEPYRESPAKPAIWDIARRFYRMATEAYHQGRSIVYSRQVVEDYPDTKFAPHALVVLFWSYRKLGKLEEVYPYLEDVAQRNFGLEVCRVAMELGMKELLDRGEFLGVVERAREIMDVFPDRERNENLKFLIAEAYELSGDVVRARDAYRDFLEEYPLVDEEGDVRILSALAMKKLGLEPTRLGKAVAEGSDVSLEGFPNPFNVQVVIGFSLPEAGFVRLGVYDVLGRKVRTLVEGKIGSGLHRVVWDGRDDGGREVSSGVYVVRLDVGGKVFARKVVMVR